jgi:SAM-dependent methyltransferase
MVLDITHLRDFYTTPLGHITQKLVAEGLKRQQARMIKKGYTTGAIDHRAVLGLGYVHPYLESAHNAGEHVVICTGEKQGALRWPEHGPYSAVLADFCALPFPDNFFDHILLIHSFELSAKPNALLENVWRILAPTGQVTLVVPNRRGLWVRTETTPFGYGQPYSRSQLSLALRHALFVPEEWSEVLYGIPLHYSFCVRSMVFWERFGQTLRLPSGGVLLVTATKHLYEPTLACSGVRGMRVLHPELLPGIEVGMGS